jgi:hypothetical protein
MTDFKPKQLQAIELLAQGNTIARTSQIIGCKDDTIGLWKHIPGFNEAVTLRAKEIIRVGNEAAYAHLAYRAPKYLGILEDIIDDSKNAAAVRVRAIALALATQAQLKGVDVDGEIQELKEIIGDRKDETE